MTAESTTERPALCADSRTGRPVTKRRRWRPSVLLLITALVALTGATLLAYSPAAIWLSAINQSTIVDTYADDVVNADPAPATQLAEARAYNDALSSGAVLAANTNVPEGDGEADDAFAYRELLATRNGVMARIRIPSIGVDLPVYHGTDDATLLRGAGHLEGTSLPVGGESTHAVITAHRGLADATMFTDLDKVVEGDTVTITVFGEVLTYRVVETRVVQPEETETLRQVAGEDLLTLVTCTPLGINTQRMLVTAERVTPTPEGDQEAALSPSDPDLFPWWLLAYVGALVVIAVFVWRAGLERSRG